MVPAYQVESRLVGDANVYANHTTANTIICTCMYSVHISIDTCMCTCTQCSLYMYTSEQCSLYMCTSVLEYFRKPLIL